MDCRKMKKTTSQVQFEFMVNFLQKHPELMTLMPRTYEPTSSRRQLWDRLSRMLNDRGPPTRSSKAWRSIWSDYKYNIKRKLCTDVKCTKGKRPFLSSIEEKVVKMLKFKAKPCNKHYNKNANAPSTGGAKGEVAWCDEYTQNTEEPVISYDDSEDSFDECLGFESEGEKSDLATEIDEPFQSAEIKKEDNMNPMDCDVTLMLKDTLQGMQKTQLKILKELTAYNQQKKDTCYLKEQQLHLEREKFEEQKKQNSVANRRAALQLDLKRKELELYRMKVKGTCTNCMVKTENVEYIISNV